VFRIALANLQFPTTPEHSVILAEQAIAQASSDGAGIICFPECFTSVVEGALLITALVINRDGTIAGFQDKVQIDPSEEGVYSPG
jgi:predicted amidohydrolase